MQGSMSGRVPTNEVSLMQMAERGIGFVGDITSIKPDLISTLVEGGYIPVVASVAADYDGQALNVNADIAAGEVSKSPAHAGSCKMPSAR
jgi:acetylglutamate kinase